MKRLLAGAPTGDRRRAGRDHAVRRPHSKVKDYQEHVVATLFGRVTIRLPRFRCGACSGSESGIDWPLHCRFKRRNWIGYRRISRPS